MRYGRFAPANPWPATGLEWRTPSPPPTENFAVTPVVTWEAYEFRPVEEMEIIGPGETADVSGNGESAQPCEDGKTALRALRDE